MDALENAAFVSIGRGCGFAGLAVFCVVAGLSFEPALATRIGGVMCLIVTLYLCFGAFRAHTRPYKKTEVWLILPKTERPPADVAQRLVGQALYDTYLWFAQQCAAVTAVIGAVAVWLQVSV